MKTNTTALIFASIVLITIGFFVGKLTSDSNEEEPVLDGKIVTSSGSASPIIPTCSYEDLFTKTDLANSRMITMFAGSFSRGDSIQAVNTNGDFCKFDLTDYIDSIAASLSDDLKDGFADYVYLQDQRFLLSRPTSLWTIDLKSNSIVKVWELPTPMYAISIAQMTPFYYDYDSVVVFQTKPTGLGGSEQLTQLQELLEHSCRSVNAGFWSFSTKDTKVKKITSINSVDSCLAR